VAARAAGLQGTGHAQAHVAAADDQQALAAKARWQRAEGFGLKAKWKVVFSREVFTHCKRQAQQQPLPVTAAKDNQNVMTDTASSTHQITVQPSGRQFATQGAETILAAAIRSGVGLPYGCKDGACGSCKCKKLSGSVVHGTHSDKALTPPKRPMAMC
jgi:ferredoxin